jgi:RHS repeat-associated protein
MAYAYDAFGERAASFADSSTVPFFHLRGLGNELLTTIHFDGGKTFERQEDYVYLGGRPLGVKKGAYREHYHLDHLGTQKMRTGAYGYADYSLVSPYGVEIPGSQIDKRIFTGHERDFSTDTDYMHARHYYSEMARFLSVDSLRGNPARPQSLNRYAYAIGNPVGRFDPDGRSAASLKEAIEGFDGVFGEPGSYISDNVIERSEDPFVVGGLKMINGTAIMVAGGYELYYGGRKLEPHTLIALGFDASQTIQTGAEEFADGLATFLGDDWVVSHAEEVVVDFFGGTVARLGLAEDGMEVFGSTTIVTATAETTRKERFQEWLRQLLIPRTPNHVIEQRNLQALRDLRSFGNLISPGLNLGTAGGGASPFCDASGNCWVYTLVPPKK